MAARILAEPADLVRAKHWEKSDTLATRTSKAWLSYMDYFVETKLAGIKYLLKHLGNLLPPEGLSSFFREAKKCPSMGRAMEQSPETMFKVIGLAEKEEAVIKHPTFPIWLADKQSHDSRYPAYKKSFTAIFAYHFGRDSVPKLVHKLKEVHRDKKTRLARTGIMLSLDDVS
ncbi:hypothetical protein PsorP6_010247 [Peronosclerospora sorghi]|uniref:Uncharacterized protein n=1 Tax=Peronosclerospora sorghi TaxID=230839 RepID=A0ACC0VVG9_9STRA|nr:hypothetical protein PsorP6_010247 [Peronosclerospora sorghi]